MQSYVPPAPQYVPQDFNTSYTTGSPYSEWLTDMVGSGGAKRLTGCASHLMVYDRDRVPFKVQLHMNVLLEGPTRNWFPDDPEPRRFRFLKNRYDRQFYQMMDLSETIKFEFVGWGQMAYLSLTHDDLAIYRLVFG